MKLHAVVQLSSEGASKYSHFIHKITQTSGKESPSRSTQGVSDSTELPLPAPFPLG